MSSFAPRHLPARWACIGVLAAATAAACASLDEVRRTLPSTKPGPISARVQYEIFQPADHYRILNGDPSHAETRSVVLEQWAADGEKLYSRTRGSGGSWAIDSFDGELRQRYLFQGESDTQLEIHGRRASLRNPLEWGYTLQGRWYRDILATVEPRLKEERRHPVFGRTIVFEIDYPEGSTTVVHWSPRQRVAVETDLLTNRGQDRVVIRTEEMTEVGPHSIPRRGTSEWYIQDRGRWTLVRRTEMTIDDVRPTADLTPFEIPELPPGTQIEDNIRNERFVVGEGGEWISRGKIGVNDPDPDPERPPPPNRAGWLFFLASLTLVLGGVAAFLRWKRARSPSPS